MMKCSIETCKDKAKYNGLCGMHYKRRWRHGDPNKTLTPTRGFERIQCIAEEGCESKSVHSLGLCDRHYQMQRVSGRTQRIINAKGEGSVQGKGYVIHTINGKRVYEHIVIAERALGRPLPKGAVVHHTGERGDNYGYCKLVICPDQAYHLLLHRRMRELGYENN